MTPAYITPPKEKRVYRFSAVRMLTIGLMLFLLVTACLYLYHTALRAYSLYLTESEKKSTAWMVEQLSFMLPFIAVAVFQYAVYAGHDNRDGILQREKAYELLIVAALTYLVLLPLIGWYSDTKLTLSLMAELDVPKNEGKEYETLFLAVAEWFLRFAIPLCLLFVYHMGRARSEQSELREAAEMTAERPPENATPSVPSPATTVEATTKESEQGEVL